MGQHIGAHLFSLRKSIEPVILVSDSGSSKETFLTIKAKLQNIIKNEDLRRRIHQDFREVGNALLFCLYIEQALVSFYLFFCLRICFNSALF